jgi:hypothetical protein
VCWTVFLEGPKVLFRVGLATLRINGKELLDVQDDGSFISILKSYFSSLGELAYLRSENQKLGAVTLADHEFMQRLFRNWDVDRSQGLSLQNVVNGLAHLKGMRDVMNSIDYFF